VYAFTARKWVEKACCIPPTSTRSCSAFGTCRRLDPRLAHCLARHAGAFRAPGRRVATLQKRSTRPPPAYLSACRVGKRPQLRSKPALTGPIRQPAFDTCRPIVQSVCSRCSALPIYIAVYRACRRRLHCNAASALPSRSDNQFALRVFASRQPTCFAIAYGNPPHFHPFADIGIRVLQRKSIAWRPGCAAA